MRWIERAGRTRRSARSADPHLIEQQQNPFRLDAVKRKITRIRQPRLPRPVPDYTADVLNDAMLQFIPQGSDTCVLVFKVGERQFRRLPKSNHARDILCATAPASLLPAANDEGLILCATADIEAPDPFGRMQLVR